MGGDCGRGVLGAAFMLYMFSGRGSADRNPKNERLIDLSHRELATFARSGVAFWMGLYPALFRDGFETSFSAHGAWDPSTHSDRACR